MPVISLAPHSVWLFLAAISTIVGAASCAGTAYELVIEDSDGLILGESRVEVSEIADEYNDIRQTFIDSERQFAECVRALGYEYKPRRIEISLPETEYFPTVAELRRTHGYGIVNGEGNTGSVVDLSGGTVPIDQNANFSTNVLLDNEGDCMQFYFRSDIQETLYRLRITESAPSERVLADPRYAETQEEWRSCMTDKGFTYRDRFEPFNDIETQLAALDPAGDNYDQERKDLEAEEVRIASADIDCHLAEVEPVVAALIKVHG